MLPSVTASPSITLPAQRRLTVDEYERMIEAGILQPDERLELIEGEILAMSPLNAPHAYCVRFLNQFFTENLRRQVVVDIQSPVRLSETSRPEPDVMLLRYRPDLYRGRLPTATDVLLIVEVSDTTLDYDRQVKSRLYAQAGIGEFWIADLVGQKFWVFSQPEQGIYSALKTYGAQATLAPLAFPQLALPVSEALGLPSQ